MLHILLTLSILFATHTAHAIIIETDSMLSIVHYALDDRYANHEKLIAFDIDNTIQEPMGWIGGSTWFDYNVEKNIAMGMSYFQAYEHTLSLIDSLQKIFIMQPVESITPYLIQEFQKTRIPVVALTARPIGLLSHTLHQISSIGIEFAANESIPDHELDLTHETHYAGYRNGIIFCSHHNCKGRTLVEFIKKSTLVPKLIIFIDDILKYVKAVEKTITNLGIECIAIHYTFSQIKAKNFKPEEAEAELQTLLSKISN
jgi:hypothetical protein